MSPDYRVVRISGVRILGLLLYLYRLMKREVLPMKGE